MKNILNDQINNSKKDSFPLNNTISCYHRPRINYFKSINNQNKNKIINKTIKINLNKTKKIKLNKYRPEIESKLISFYKINNSFSKFKNNSENFNHNSFSKTMNRPKSFVSINNEKMYISNFKQKNINYSNTDKNFKKNYIYNSLLLNYNNKSSISKDIAILCKIINSIDYTPNNKLSRNKKNKLSNNNSINNINIYYCQEKKIIIIQRWWRKMIYHLYIEKNIILIQHKFREYMKMKKNCFDNKNLLNIKKIIIIQKAWKKYINNKCLHNYYFFSFKKYIKPKKENKFNDISSSNLIHNIAKNNSRLSKLIDYKDNNYITKLHYKMNQINDNNEKIQKLQRMIKRFLYNKNNLYKIKNINKINSIIIKPCYITKDKKYISYIINNTLISKIIKIQKHIRKYKSSKLIKSDFRYINEENYLIDINNKEIIRKKFSSYISLKLSKFFLLILNRINVFYFIKIINQRIKKNITQNIFLKLFNIEKKEMNSYSYFFQTIWRHLKINISTKNEISLLLSNTIPKFFKDKFPKKFIPYITSKQENKIINTQLFKNDDDELIKYIFYFIEKDKNIKLSLSKKTIKYHLNKYNLKNRNIFFITRYIDSLYKDLIKKKLKINEIKENININEEIEYLQTEENTNDIKNIENLNDINTNFIINRTNTYCAKNFRFKFIDYLNKNSEFLKKQ